MSSPSSPKIWSGLGVPVSSSPAGVPTNVSAAARVAAPRTARAPIPPISASFRRMRTFNTSGLSALREDALRRLAIAPHLGEVQAVAREHRARRQLEPTHQLVGHD